MHMPGALIASKAPGESLSAKVEARHDEAVTDQFADRLRIFLDALIAALNDDHGAERLFAHREKQGVAQLLSPAPLKEARHLSSLKGKGIRREGIKGGVQCGLRSRSSS